MEVIFTFSLILDSLVWNDAVLRGTSTFSNLPSQCQWGEVPAIISNSNQYDLLKEKFSNVEADKEIWLGITRTSQGTLNIISYIRNKKYLCNSTNPQFLYKIKEFSVSIEDCIIILLILLTMVTVGLTIVTTFMVLLEINMWEKQLTARTMIQRLSFQIIEYFIATFMQHKS